MQVYPAVLLGIAVELHLSGLIWKASHLDKQKIGIIGFFFEMWQFEVEKNSTNGCFWLHI
jgi:hypothetical protein